MTYFSVLDFVESGKKSLEDENYWSALCVALTLPSMCSRIMFEGNQDEYKVWKWIDKNDHSKGKTYGRWKDKKCYVDFCNEILIGLRITEIIGNCDLGERLYDLRCDILHSGNYYICDESWWFYLTTQEHNPNMEASLCRPISVPDLCGHIFACVEMWCNDSNINRRIPRSLYETK